MSEITDSIINNLSDAFRLQVAHAEVECARQMRNYASLKLDACQIHERIAELHSTSFEYVARGSLFKKFTSLSPREMDIMRAATRYAVFGRID